MTTARTRSSTGPETASCPGFDARRRPRRRVPRPAVPTWWSAPPATSGPHLIRQLAAEGATAIVAVSRRPGTALDDVARAVAATGTTVVTVAADAADESAMTELFERFGADLPPLSAIYLAAFGGGPVTLQDMTDHDVEAMFRPEARRRRGAAPPFAAPAGASIRDVLLDLGPAGITVAWPLRGDHDLPGRAGLRAARRGSARHHRRLGTVAVAGRGPERSGTPRHPGVRTAPDVRRDRDRGNDSGVAVDGAARAR